MKEYKYRLISLKETESTNLYAKELLDKKENCVITAKRQSGGRGTKGRSFHSAEGGVYLSKLTFYERFPAKEAFKIMAGAAVAVCETLAYFGLSPYVKWANDVFVNGKKICGILIENRFSGENISSSIVGVGLNVNNALPEELLSIATTMEKEGGKNFSVEEVKEKLVEEMERCFSIEDYRKYLGFIGEEVDLLVGEERVPATLLSVTDEGALETEVAGEKRIFTSAEVSIRTMER